MFNASNPRRQAAGRMNGLICKFRHDPDFYRRIGALAHKHTKVNHAELEALKAQNAKEFIERRAAATLLDLSLGELKELWRLKTAAGC